MKKSVGKKVYKVFLSRMEPLYVYKNDDLEKYEGMCVYVRGDDMETKKGLKYK